MNVIKDIPDFALSSQLERIVFSAGAALTFTLTVGAQQVLKATYQPDNRGRVAIEDVFELLEPYLMEHPLIEAKYVAEIGSDKREKIFKVLMCRLYMNTTAEYFVQNTFLNALAGRDKVTALGRTEKVYATWGKMSNDNVKANYAVEAVYTNANYAVLKQTIRAGAINTNGIQSIDVSPSQFNKGGYTLLRYTVICEGRAQTFRVDHSGADAQGVSFKNSFGCKDTFYFTGLRNIEPEIERYAARIEGYYRNYNVRERRLLKMNTGFLNGGMFSLADDVARSTELSLLLPAGKELPLVITESETKRNNSAHELQAMSITCRLAAQYQDVLPVVPDIFDSTFDDSFN